MFIGREIPVFIFIEMLKGYIFVIVDAFLNRIIGRRHRRDFSEEQPHDQPVL